MSIRIIDISSHQDPSTINYDKLCQNIDGVILRAAYGIRIQGVPGPDQTFERHYAEFSKRGVPIGVYHYICEWCTAKDQAELMSKTIKGKKFQLGVWADVEIERGELPLTEQTVVDYMTLMEKLTGIKLDVYTGFYYWRDIMVSNPAKYADRKLWLSAYTSSPIPYIPPAWKTWWMWQYTSHGRIAGYTSDLDFSYFNGDQAAFNAWIGKENDYPALALTPFSQKDSRWASDHLGTSNSTIAGYGCLISDVAMVLNYFGKDTDPGRLNKALIGVNGYLNGNLLIYGKVTEIYPDIVMERFVNGNVTSGLIDSILSEGKPAIVEVDYNPADADIDQHWVTIIGKAAGDYIILDPIDGKEVMFKTRYSDPATHIYRVVVYNKKEQELPMLFKVKVLVPNLLIRTGPDKSYPYLKGYASGEYEVFEEANNYYRIGTGKWISANPGYTQKIDADPPEITDAEKLNRLWEAHPELH